MCTKQASKRVSVTGVQSGNRWQTASSLGIDQKGIVQWSRKAGTADGFVDFKEAMQAVVS